MMQQIQIERLISVLEQLPASLSMRDQGLNRIASALGGIDGIPVTEDISSISSELSNVTEAIQDLTRKVEKLTLAYLTNTG